MNEVKMLLNENKSGFLATICDGKPKVRPFEFQFESNGKYYFCTNNKKEVYKQLKENNFIEWSVTSKDYVTLRINGEIIFSNEFDIKKKIVDNNKLIESIYKTPENPIFEIFYLEHGEAIISDFSGKPPQKFTF